mgnify:CR=1 FL=1
MEELIVLTKSMKTSFNLYLFLMLSILSFSVFAGADPDEITLEDEVQLQEQVKKEVVKKKPLPKVKEQVVIISDGCLSFPEAIAYKEHFACRADIEKNLLARKNWSFAQLIVLD